MSAGRPLAIPFDGYDTDLRGHTLGECVIDQETGRGYMLVKAHTVVINDAFAIGEPVVAVHVTAAGPTGTQDVSEGLDGTHPVALGFAASACPESTATVTYYFWVQRRGPVCTTRTGTTLAAVPNNGTDITKGDQIVTSSTDQKVAPVAAGTGVPVAKYMGYALITETGVTIAGVWADMSC
jgi:hypothetical protein